MKHLLGKSLHYVIEALAKQGCNYDIVFTRDPKATTENASEKVIRIKEADYSLTILVGYFQDSTV